jgi:hypothetical protein
MQRRLGELFRKAPEFAAACDRRMIVEKHAVRIAAFAALEGHRDDLAALGVVAEARGIRHADEFEFDQRLLDLQRLGDQFAQFLRIGSVGDDEVFAIDETVRPHRIGRTRERHGKSPRLHITFLHSDSCCEH